MKFSCLGVSYTIVDCLNFRNVGLQNLKVLNIPKKVFKTLKSKGKSIPCRLPVTTDLPAVLIPIGPPYPFKTYCPETVLKQICSLAFPFSPILLQWYFCSSCLLGVPPTLLEPLQPISFIAIWLHHHIMETFCHKIINSLSVCLFKDRQCFEGGI